MISHNLIRELDAEHEYQKKKWGTSGDDSKNTPWMWASYISQYATKWMVGEFLPIGRTTTESFRTCMVKVATIAISAIESIDRQRENNGSTFYEEST